MSGTLAGRVKKPKLEDCEKQIQTAIDAARETWATIGAQLAVIRDNELYPDKSFEEYCERRWEFSRAHAYRLIGGAKVVRNLSPAGGARKSDGQAPATERQARELENASADPKEQRKVWNTAKELAGTDQPASPVIKQAAEIVREATSGNLETIEIDAALREFAGLVKKMEKAGKRIQTAFNAKVGTCRAMQTRKAKFDKKIAGLAERVDFVREYSDDLANEWGRTKKQVDE